MLTATPTLPRTYIGGTCVPPTRERPLNLRFGPHVSLTQRNAMIRVFFKLGSRQTSTTDTTTVRCSSAYLPNRRKLPTFLQNGQMGVSLPSLIKSFANLIGVEELYLYRVTEKNNN